MPFCLGMMRTVASHIFPRQGAFSAYGQTSDRQVRLGIRWIEAKAAAGDRNVLVHGAYTAQAALAAGVLDELQIHQIPVLFGGGRRLFEVLPDRIELRIAGVIDTPEVTHLRYRTVSLTVALSLRPKVPLWVTRPKPPSLPPCPPRFRCASRAPGAVRRPACWLSWPWPAPALRALPFGLPVLPGGGPAVPFPWRFWGRLGPRLPLSPRDITRERGRHAAGRPQNRRAGDATGPGPGAGGAAPGPEARSPREAGRPQGGGRRGATRTGRAGRRGGAY